MTWDLTPEQLDLQQRVREFADTVVAPAAYDYDTERRLPIEIIAQMGDMGLFELPYTQNFASFCLAIEALARVDQSIAVTLEAGIGLGVGPLHRYGTEEQKKRWLPDLLAGRALAGFGLTEANAGSDAAATETTAVLEGEGEDAVWVINGTKQFITNSGTPITSLVIITAVTGQVTRKDGSTGPELSTIIVPSGTPGFAVEDSYDKVGWHTSDTHPLTLKDVRVPKANLLGERGRGYANFLRTLDEGRVAFAALAAGAAQGCYEQALRYAKERVVFGRPIGQNQYVAFKIAAMKARAHTAHLAMMDAAHRIDAGLPFKTEASMAKMVTSDAAMVNAREATQVWGGYGFLNQNAVARHYRDSKILEIGEGTTEVQLMIIARELGLTA
ncbi:MAG TPA: acyl-CoA dehydrogenase family protein [Pseudolysinimonas sp.]|nr:acyl-CoA dehydrogenase family protein [Pseudolysinimonas sp.]